MNAYVIHITLQTGVDLQAANNNLKDAISAIEGLPATAVEVFYAALGGSYDYVAIVQVPKPDDAIAAATILSVAGPAKTSVTPAMTADAYGDLLVQTGNKK